ncbi:hypothetical protein VNO78_34391 [Psophocarpus tetragonolobus]|uniref:non-specific serine/threonine protein kinase n=1 Tax=Psophocarpus tetragonolobus TaxID=3891 RepID=A0AAN9NZ17_PSOTE
MHGPPSEAYNFFFKWVVETLIKDSERSSQLAWVYASPLSQHLSPLPPNSLTFLASLASTDSNSVGFSATTSSNRKSQFSVIASGSIDSESSLRPPLPLPLPFPDGQILKWPDLKVFSFEELKSATKRFKQDSFLGEGGFGKVYKGWLDEKTLSPVEAGLGKVVAIKKLNPQGSQGFREWQTEINFLGRLDHPNLVKLVGYCWDVDKLLLVYEFMSKGSLENRLFRRNPDSGPLSWNTRLKIAIGAARGLAFLHASECPIIFRDFKSSNVLLDGNFNAKISDFGLATSPPPGKSHISTCVVGTFGYAAPEYVATGHLTVKSDVYGFGVVLLEIVTGVRALDTQRPRDMQILVKWARPYLSSKRRFKNIMDVRIEGQFSLEAALQTQQIIVKCLAHDSKQRPSMKDVLEKLEAIKAIQNP